MAASVKKGAVWKDGKGSKVTVQKYTDKTMKKVQYLRADGKTAEMEVARFKKNFTLSKEAPKQTPRAKAAKPVKAKARRKVKAA